jgi:hypothetical protein
MEIDRQYGENRRKSLRSRYLLPFFAAISPNESCFTGSTTALPAKAGKRTCKIMSDEGFAWEPPFLANFRGFAPCRRIASQEIAF